MPSQTFVTSFFSNTLIHALTPSNFLFTCFCLQVWQGKARQLRGQSIQLRGIYSNQAIPELRTVMAAVLLTAGPVTSFGTVVKNRRQMRHLQKDRYLSALRELEALGFGYITTVCVGKTLQLFIKSHPSEVEGKLREQRDLGTILEYQQRFDLPSPSYIGTRIQDYLVINGHVQRSYFKDTSNQHNE